MKVAAVESIRAVFRTAVERSAPRLRETV